MRTFNCQCGSTVFFENTWCLACQSELGWCPACVSIQSMSQEEGGAYRCMNSNCGALLRKCHNYEVEKVCNRFVLNDVALASEVLCDYCQFNDTIPDLNIEGNREKWARLEVGKRRLLYTLDLLKLPYGDPGERVDPRLSFDFKGDVLPERRFFWVMTKEERVFTGHANGKITINVREADDVEREKARVSFQEAHRTVIGHFRHEIGHYFWDLLVKEKCEQACIEVFGDHNQSYEELLQQYYENGPKPNWQASYISSYATMHPWEDFAECFATYLDMVSVLDTALNMGIGDGVDPTTADLTTMVEHYMNLGVILNEMNRAVGLLDLVPDILTKPVQQKMEFLHQLLRTAAAGTSDAFVSAPGRGAVTI